MSPRGRVPAYALALVLAVGALARAQEAKAPPAARALAVLKSDAPLEQKYEVCRQLAARGAPDAVPVLADLLGDPKLSHMARYALEPSPDPAAGQALRDALGSLRGDLLIGVVHSIGVRRDAQAVGALAALAEGPDARVAAAAAEALGRIATPEAAAVLAKLRKAPPKSLLPAVADASLRAAQGLLRDGHRDQALPIYQDLRAAQWPAHVRLGAFAGLLAADPDQAPARILEAVASGDPVLRATAIAHIPTLKSKGVAAGFAAELPKTPPEAQVLLIHALAKRPDARVTLQPALGAALKSPSADVRLAALDALGAVGDAASVPLLTAALEKDSPAEKQAAAAALRALDDEGVNEAILARLQGAPPAIRPELIAALADRKAHRAVEELLRQARETEPAIRSAALRALALLAQPEHLPDLFGFLASLEADAGRAEAERAIVQVSRKHPKAPSAPALAELRKATNPATRASLLRVLGAIADAPALQAVQAAAEAQDPAVRDAALRVLADWPDPRPLDTLARLVRTTDNPTHRVLALRGCVRLLALGSTPPEKALELLADLAARAQRPDDRKLVLSGLANVADPAALQAIEPFRKDPATRGEAELALLSVARAILGTAPSQAQAVARTLAAEAKDPAVQKQAAAVLQAAKRLGDYVTAWQVAGPYQQEGKDGSQLIDVAFPPERPDAEGVAWRPLPVRTEPPQPWMLQLHPLFGGPDRVAYVRTWVHSDQARPALLDFGTDDGSKVWVNGQLVHADGTGGAAAPGEHKVPVRLREGWNALRMKVTQYSGPWQFCLRIRSEGGGPLPGLRLRAAPPPQ